MVMRRGTRRRARIKRRTGRRGRAAKRVYGQKIGYRM